MLRGILHKALVLAGGHGLAALVGVLAVAAAARLLGARAFGELMLAHAYALAFAGLLRLNPGPAVPAYGAAALENGDHGMLRRLFARLALLELATAVIALLLAQALLDPLRPWLGWPDPSAAWVRFYVLMVVAGSQAAPAALLRLFDRFAQVAALRVVTPAIRLSGALLVAVLGGGLVELAAVWLLASMVESGLMWGLALRELGRRRAQARCEAAAPHALSDGLAAALAALHLRAALRMIPSRLATLLLGGLLGAEAAGLYQLAFQTAGALGRVADLLRKAFEPVFARALARARHERLQRAALRLALGMAAVSWPLLALAALQAGPLLALVGGPAFARGRDLLVLLLAQQALTLPLLAAPTLLLLHGRMLWLLAVTLAARLVFLATLALLAPALGLEAAGVAAVAGGLVEALGLAVALRGRSAAFNPLSRPMGWLQNRAQAP